MIHGPCREGLCKEMINGVLKCKKFYPKQTYNETVFMRNNYPKYRRRRFTDQPEFYNNSFVTPYKTFLLKKYNAHINVEITTHMTSAIKYIYKYIFKGFDVASLILAKNGEISIDEVKNYISGRYVGSQEAMWRIFEFHMHDRSHTVVRLPLHTEYRDEIEFDDAMQTQPIPEREHATANSMLNAFFEFNRLNPNLRLFYLDIPKQYRYDNTRRQWVERRQNLDKVVTRIHQHGGINSELFALRVLLLNVPGPRDFAHLRRVNGIDHDTFREAAQALNLIRNDQIYHQTFRNLIPLNMPPQLRQLFASLLINGIISTAANFWIEYRDHMIEDFRRIPGNENATDNELYNMALQDLNARFLRVGKTCRNFDLQTPVGNQNQYLPAPAPAIQIPQNIVLNPAQQDGFDHIMAAARGININRRCFVVIGPGGSGKTTLYKEVIEACKIENLKVKLFFCC